MHRYHIPKDKRSPGDIFKYPYGGVFNDEFVILDDKEHPELKEFEVEAPGEKVAKGKAKVPRKK